MEFKSTVYIGRFQPFHIGHEQVLKRALARSEKVTLVIGSHRSASNIKNPWSFEERQEMIEMCLSPNEKKRANFVGVRDYFYNDAVWVTDVLQKTAPHRPTAIVGTAKDMSTYYLRYFSKWEFITMEMTDLNATEIRNSYFHPNTDWVKRVPLGIGKYLEWFARTPDFKKLQEELIYYRDYKERFSALPYPPIFVTVDAVVTCNGHILLVRRGESPGKGLVALPGGFVKAHERIEDAMLRELFEETGVDMDIARAATVGRHVFDHPGRSLRGRTVSHAFHVKLPSIALAQAGDDAREAFWIPIMDLNQYENEFFEDHAHIIDYFIRTP